ncbi:MAG: DUF1844 domain-containing protein [Thermoanaerobaculia bacterium]
MGDIKVTDRRMFTPEGELREGYVEEENEASAAEPVAPPPEPPPAPAPEPARPIPERPPLELPPTSGGIGGASFYDLVGVLADTAVLYLGEVPLPDGQSAENLELARLHIDLLDILRQRTAGNLSAQESAFLEDALYRLKLRYVQKRG